MALRKYVYLSVPWKPTPPIFGRQAPYTVYSALEAYLLGQRCPAEILKLIDGTVVYRVLRQHLDKFTKDKNGPVLNVIGFGVFRFSDTDPTTLVKPVKTNKDWTPIF